MVRKVMDHSAREIMTREKVLDLTDILAEPYSVHEMHGGPKSEDYSGGEIRRKGEAAVHLLFGDRIIIFRRIFIGLLDSLIGFFSTMKTPNHFDPKLSNFMRKQCESGVLSVYTHNGDTGLLGSWTDGGKCIGMVLLFCRKFNSAMNRFDIDIVDTIYLQYR